MRITTTLALLLVGSAFALQAQDSTLPLTVKGKIEGIKSGRLYLLARVSENKVDTLGTARFKGADFVMKAHLAEPVMAQLVVEGYSGGFTLLAEPGANYDALLKNGEGAYIRGGKLHDEWRGYISHSEEQRQRLDTLKKRSEQLRSENKFRSASAVNDTLRRLEQQISQETREFLARHDDVIAAHTMQENAVMKEAGLEESLKMYASLGEKARLTPSGRLMKGRIDRMSKTAQGRPAPDFTLPTPTGREVTLSKVKGKIKIIDFWASWCGPCRLNNPALKKAYETYHERGLEIIGVSLDDKLNRWTDALAKDGLPWINVSSLKGWGCPVARQYNITGVPAIFILDADNRIIATNLRGEQLMSFLEERLGH